MVGEHARVAEHAALAAHLPALGVKTHKLVEDAEGVNWRFGKLRAQRALGLGEASVAAEVDAHLRGQLCRGGEG